MTVHHCYNDALEMIHHPVSNWGMCATAASGVREGERLLPCSEQPCLWVTTVWLWAAAAFQWEKKKEKRGKKRGKKKKEVSL